MGNSLPAFDEQGRRRFMKAAAGSLLGVSFLPEWVRADDRRQPSGKKGARNLIYLYMDGGMSHVDTWDPKQGDVAGPTRAIQTDAEGIRLGEYLPRSAKIMRHGTIVRSLTSTQGAHEQGNYFMHTSYQMRGTINHPSLGAWLSHFQGPGNQALPASVYVGNASRHPGAGFFPPEHAPLFVNNPENGLRDIRRAEGLTEAKHAGRLSLASGIDADFVKAFGGQRNVLAHASAYDGAARMMASKDTAAFNLAEEKDAARDAYGRDPFGQGCLLARRLVERGVRFVEVSLHGWDTHSNNFTTTPDLCDKLDRGLSVLVSDLRDRGMLGETLVVVATEFGRSPKINTALGRDHYPNAFSAALFGGGVRGGHVHGETDKRGETVTRDETSVQDFNASLGHALGLPLDRVVHSPEKRPFKLADKGQPLKALFS